MELNATIVVQLVVFLFGVLWLSFFLFRPMLRLLEEREKRIAGAKAEAQRMAASGSEKEGIIEIRLEEARSQALAERAQLRTEGQKVYAQVVSTSRQQAQEKLGQARAELAQAHQQASQVLQREAGELASLIVERIAARPGGRP